MRGPPPEATPPTRPRHTRVTPSPLPSKPGGKGPKAPGGKGSRGRVNLEHIGSRAVEISRVGVVGLGTMGAGIAQVCLQAGLEVVGRAVTLDLGEAAHGRIDHYLTRGVEKERLTQDEKDAALGRLTLTTELADLAGCRLVIEAAFEDLEVKRELFAELDRILPPPAILATNTSALSVTQIADATATPERVVGLHFFNPASVLPRGVVVRTAHTSDEAFDAAHAFAQRIGKESVACNDTPGLMVNRLLVPPRISFCRASALC